MKILIGGSIAAILVLLCLTAESHAGELTVRGHLAPTVEAGGWLIVTESDKYLLLNAERFQQQKWFREGARVEATGETRPEKFSVYQEGIPFEARTMSSQQEARSAAVTSNPSGKHMIRVLVTGKAILQRQPDTATVYLAVVTQGKNAIDAQQENAVKSASVIRAVKDAMGAGAEVGTSGYAVTPMRIYNQGSPPVITGYEVHNRITVTLSDLLKVGNVLDAAGQAGANDVQGISFTLRRDTTAREQSLSEATRQAVGKAQAIAKTLGGRMVRVVQVQEGAPAPVPIRTMENMQRVASAAAPTPVEVGALDVSSEVQVLVEIESPQ